MREKFGTTDDGARIVRNDITSKPLKKDKSNWNENVGKNNIKNKQDARRHRVAQFQSDWISLQC